MDSVGRDGMTERNPQRSVTLSACLAIRNAVRFDYPLRECLLAVAPVCEEIVVVFDPSGNDTTIMVLENVKREIADFCDLRIEPVHWWSKEPKDGYSGGCIADAQNLAIQISKSEWFFVLQADEVMHENEAPLLRDIPDRNECDLIELGHLHFWTSPERIMIDPNSEKRVRIGRRELFPNVKCLDDGSRIGGDGEYRVLSLVGLVDIRHYGNVRQPTALIYKQREMAQLYGWGEGDPRLERGLLTGEVNWNEYGRPTVERPHNKPHPKVAVKWLEMRKREVEKGTVKR